MLNTRIKRGLTYLTTRNEQFTSVDTSIRTFITIHIARINACRYWLIASHNNNHRTKYAEYSAGVDVLKLMAGRKSTCTATCLHCSVCGRIDRIESTNARVAEYCSQSIGSEEIERRITFWTDGFRLCVTNSSNFNLLFVPSRIEY